MPAIFDSQPSSLIYKSQSLCYQASLDNIGAANETKKIIFQFFQSDIGGGNERAVNAQKAFEPDSITDKLELNLMKLAIGKLSYVTPNLSSSNSPIPDTLFKGEFFLRLIEYTLNTDTGVETFAAAVDSNHTIVINGAIQDYQSVTLADPTILTDKSQVNIYEDSCDWIRIYGSDTVSITFHYSPTDTETVFFNPGAPPAPIIDSLVPTGPRQIFQMATPPVGFTTGDIFKYVVTFGSGKMVTYLVQKAAIPYDKRIDIYFIEPKGSPSVMTFECKSPEQINMDVREICRTGLCTDDTATLFTTYGRNVMNIRRWTTFALRRPIFVHKDNIEYYRAFGNAVKWLAAYKFAEGTKKDLLCPLIPQSLEVPLNHRAATRLQFSALYGHDLRQ